MSKLFFGFLVFFGLSASQAKLKAPYGISFTKYMCTDNGCVPLGIKDMLRNCWTETGRILWSSCVGETGVCTPDDEFRVSKCLHNRVENMTDITVREYREMKLTMFSYTSLLDCVGDHITLNMQNCTLMGKAFLPLPRKFRSLPLFQSLYNDYQLHKLSYLSQKDDLRSAQDKYSTPSHEERIVKQTSTEGVTSTYQSERVSKQAALDSATRTPFQPNYNRSLQEEQVARQATNNGTPSYSQYDLRSEDQLADLENISRSSFYSPGGREVRVTRQSQATVIPSNKFLGGPQQSNLRPSPLNKDLLSRPTYSTREPDHHEDEAGVGLQTRTPYETNYNSASHEERIGKQAEQDERLTTRLQTGTGSSTRAPYKQNYEEGVTRQAGNQAISTKQPFIRPGQEERGAVARQAQTGLGSTTKSPYEQNRELVLSRQDISTRQPYSTTRQEERGARLTQNGVEISSRTPAYSTYSQEGRVARQTQSGMNISSRSTYKDERYSKQTGVGNVAITRTPYHRLSEEERVAIQAQREADAVSQTASREELAPEQVSAGIEISSRLPYPGTSQVQAHGVQGQAEVTSSNRSFLQAPGQEDRFPSQGPSGSENPNRLYQKSSQDGYTSRQAQSAANESTRSSYQTTDPEGPVSRPTGDGISFRTVYQGRTQDNRPARQTQNGAGISTHKPSNQRLPQEERVAGQTLPLTEVRTSYPRAGQEERVSKSTQFGEEVTTRPSNQSSTQEERITQQAQTQRKQAYQDERVTKPSSKKTPNQDERIAKQAQAQRGQTYQDEHVSRQVTPRNDLLIIPSRNQKPTTMRGLQNQDLTFDRNGTIYQEQIATAVFGLKISNTTEGVTVAPQNVTEVV